MRAQRREAPGRFAGPYRLYELLGRGGMGEVWRGEHATLGHSVAVKLFAMLSEAPLPQAEREQLEHAFFREARLTASIRSRHVAEVFDLGFSGEGVPYYAMELVGGCDLQALVQREGPLPVGRALQLLLQAARALDAVHAAQVLHGDVKSSNLQLSPARSGPGRVVLLDLGLARRLNARGTAQAPGRGSPAYLAPEAILGGPVDARADLYGLGCVAFELLTGALPFAAESEERILRAHLMQPARLPSGCALPAEVEALVLELLAKPPSHRPASAAELEGRLRALAASYPAERASVAERSRSRKPVLTVNVRGLLRTSR